MGSILDGATARMSFAGDGGKTGATFERAVLGDGTPVVIKHVTPADWAMIVSGGVPVCSAASQRRSTTR